AGRLRAGGRRRRQRRAQGHRHRARPGQRLGGPRRDRRRRPGDRVRPAARGPRAARQGRAGRRRRRAAASTAGAAGTGTAARDHGGLTRMSRFFINHPVFAWVIAILITLGGILAISDMGVESYPDIAPPQVVVSAAYPGASAETTEKAVTQVIEQQLTGI